MSGNYWDPIRNYADKHRPPVIREVYDATYATGKFAGQCVQKGIEKVESVSPALGAVARAGREYVEDKTPVFQDNRPHKK